MTNSTTNIVSGTLGFGVSKYEVEPDLIEGPGHVMYYSSKIVNMRGLGVSTDSLGIVVGTEQCWYPEAFKIQ